MIHIDRVEADVEVRRESSVDRAAAPGASTPAAATEAVPLDRLRTVVLEVLADHLRDLERRGVV